MPQLTPESTVLEHKPVRMISFVIPLMDEEETLVELYDGISQNVPQGCDFEVIFIDDGSTDSSWKVVQSLVDVYGESVRGIRFRSNRGKAAALVAGYRAALGDIVFTMDADLQDDPKEIPRFLEKLDEGFDLVSGWKKKRYDPWHKVLPSRVFNWMLSNVSGVKLHDHNCGFKCYQGQLARELSLFGELHRMVPSLAKIKGFRSTEIVVDHHARKFGRSKYGIERFLRGFSDMLTIGFQRRFSERPSHAINGVGVSFLMIGLALVITGFVSGITQLQGLVCALFGLTMGGMSVATFIAGQISEILIRGGLTSTWRLPIVEDIGGKKEFRGTIPLGYRGVNGTADDRNPWASTEFSETCEPVGISCVTD